MDVDQENMRAMKSGEEEEEHREDVRKLVKMMQKEDEEQEEQRGRMAPNMVFGGSPPGHVGPRKERDRRDEMGRL